MSKAEHAGPRRNAGEGKQMMSIRHHPVCLCVRLCLHTFLCAYERLHVYLICFQEHLIRDFEMQVSTRRKVCLFGHRRMFSSMLPGTLNDSPPLSSHSGRSWEELNSYRHTNLKAQKSDKMWQAPELLPFSASPFLSHSCFRSPLVEKKNPSSKPAFTTSVNPSQLQSLMIRSLINATGKERS